MTSIESLKDMEIALENELEEIKVKYNFMLGHSDFIYFESRKVEAQYVHECNKLKKLQDRCLSRLCELWKIMDIVRLCYWEILVNEKIDLKDKFAEYYHRLFSVSK